MRSILRSAIAGLTVGAVALGTAWAGAGLTSPPDTGQTDAPDAPVVGEDDATSSAADTVDATGAGRAATAAGDEVGRTAGGVADQALVDVEQALTEQVAVPRRRLAGGKFYVGGATASIAPVAKPDGPWQPNTKDQCGDPEAYSPFATEGCLLTFDRRWATEVDALGLNVRAVAIGNGETTVVLAVLDTVGWFTAYPEDVCGDCGSAAISAAIQEATDGAVPADGVVIASTHTHAAPDTLSTTPTWYYEHVRDATKAAIFTALRRMRPAFLETGATDAKAYNVDRRIVTRAIPDYELGWVRAITPPRPNRPSRTLATLINYAVHPTVKTDNAALHSGLVGPMVRDVEAAFGGTAVFMPGALGDQTVDRAWGVEGLGSGIAELVVADAIDGGYRLTTNDVAVDRVRVPVPGENTFMLAARGAGLFVRDTLPPYAQPGRPHAPSKGGIERPTCTTVSELDVIAPVGGIRLGRAGLPDPPREEKDGARPDPGDSIVIMTAPGEIFSSIGVTTKDYLSKTRNVLVVGMANDTIGYLIPYEQYDETGGQGLGLANNATDAGNYEEALSLGRCAGDTVQNVLLESGTRLGVMGSGEGR